MGHQSFLVYVHCCNDNFLAGRRRNYEQNKVGFWGVVKGVELGIFVEHDVYCLVMGRDALNLK